MERLEYFIRRLLLIIPTFVGITLMCFLLCQVVPGGPVEQLLSRMKGASESGAVNAAGDQGITESYRQELIEHFGFDQPLVKRYWQWLVPKRLGMTADSYHYPNKTAWQIIRERMPVSLIFGITGFLLSYLICIPLGISKALRHGGVFDLGSSVIVFVGYAVPAFAFGMVLKMVLCGTVDSLWDVFPVSGFQSDNFDELTFAAKVKDIVAHMFLPTLCYVIGNFAILTMLMKNSLLEQVSQDYVRTVLARGGSRHRAIWGHALRNALIPIATGFSGILTVMFAGAVLIESVFEIPGMGRLSFDAIVGRDYPVFMGILALTSLLGLLGNVLSDLCYVLIDPRINFRR